MTGDYDVDLLYGCDGNNAGSAFVASLANGHFAGTIKDTGGFNELHTERLGRVHLIAGSQVFRFAITNKPHGYVMDLTQVLLTPVK